MTKATIVIMAILTAIMTMTTITPTIIPTNNNDNNNNNNDDKNSNIDDSNMQQYSKKLMTGPHKPADYWSVLASAQTQAV